jgi:hypothetical protein
MNTQHENLGRVSDRIREAILDFCRAHATFFAEELRNYTAERCGKIAPGSADRVLRDLRQSGKLDYKVLNRRKSHYQVIPVVTQDVTFTPDEFRQQVCEFRQLMGTKPFMLADDETHEAATKALGFAYFRTKVKDAAEQEVMANLLDITFSEFSRRKVMILKLGIA